MYCLVFKKRFEIINQSMRMKKRFCFFFIRYQNPCPFLIFIYLDLFLQNAYVYAQHIQTVYFCFPSDLKCHTLIGLNMTRDYLISNSSPHIKPYHTYVALLIFIQGGTCILFYPCMSVYFFVRPSVCLLQKFLSHFLNN